MIKTRRKKLTVGDKFNKLTLLEWVSERKIWFCKCECGGETYARSNALSTGRHKSCKCGKTASRTIKGKTNA